MSKPKIYKYKLTDIITEIELPHSHRILSAHEQDGDIYVWALVDSESDSKVKVTFFTIGTGHDIAEKIPGNIWREYGFIDTVHMPRTGFVFHVFKKHHVS